MGIQVCWNKGPRPFPRGDNKETAKIHWKNLKIFSFITTGTISTKLGTKHPWVTGIQVCSNGGPHPFPRGDDKKIAKIHWQTWSNVWKPIWAVLIAFCLSVHLSAYKLFTFSFSSPKPLGHFLPNLAQNVLGYRGFKYTQIHKWWTGPWPKGDNSEIL